ncbi:MAG TPA: NAD-dependent epimerase/dehydratase family protein [Acidimicrobiia bacterium]|jgi:UDP-glucose 4-epimerase
MNHIVGKNIGVTGGAGFIGSHLVEFLTTQQPARLVVVDDLSAGKKENLRGFADRIELIEGDVRDPEVASELAGLDLVFHLAVRNVRASIKDPRTNLGVNAGGTLEVLEAMRHGSRGSFLYVSSSEVYGVPDSGLFAESVVPGPTTVYGAGKLAGELVTNAYHLTYGLDTRVIRPFNNFGPRSHFEGDSGEVIPKFILRALAGKPLVIHGSGTQTRDFMYVTETAHWLAVLAGLAELEGQTVNIGTGIETRISDLAETVLTMVGSESRISYGPPRPGDLPRLVAETSRIESFVPFKLDVGLEEGIKRSIEFFRSGDVEDMLGQETVETWK